MRGSNSIPCHCESRLGEIAMTIFKCIASNASLPNSEAVIPAKAGIQCRKTGSRVKPGMTINGKGFMIHPIRSLQKVD